MKWSKFLDCMTQINTEDFSKKLGLFFKMIDTDGNGMLSWDECFELCQDSLGLCKTEEGDEFVNEMSEFFADFIFETVGFDKDDEIPMDHIKNTILSECEGAELLSMFCGC